MKKFEQQKIPLCMALRSFSSQPARKLGHSSKSQCCTAWNSAAVCGRTHVRLPVTSTAISKKVWTANKDLRGQKDSGASAHFITSRNWFNPNDTNLGSICVDQNRPKHMYLTFSCFCYSGLCCCQFLLLGHIDKKQIHIILKVRQPRYSSARVMMEDLRF